MYEVEDKDGLWYAFFNPKTNILSIHFMYGGDFKFNMDYPFTISKEPFKCFEDDVWLYCVDIQYTP